MCNFRHGSKRSYFHYFMTFQYLPDCWASPDYPSDGATTMDAQEAYTVSGTEEDKSESAGTG